MRLGGSGSMPCRRDGSCASFQRSSASCMRIQLSGEWPSNLAMRAASSIDRPRFSCRSVLTVNTLLQEKRGLSIELAARIARLLGHSPESWIRMQEALDLWKLAQDPSRLQGIEPLPPSRIAT